MGLLDDFAAYVDGLKRSAKNTLADTMNDPGGLLSRRLSQVSESLPMPAWSVMPQGGGELLPRPSMQEWGTNVAMNAPTMGLLGSVNPKVTIAMGGKSMVVDRSVVESQLIKAEQASAQLRARMAERHTAHGTRPVTSNTEQAAADRSTTADLARYESIIESCRAALGAE